MRATILALTLLAAAPAAADPFPTLHQEFSTQPVVNLNDALIRCTDLKPGPKAGELWKMALRSFWTTPPNVPAVKDWVRAEVPKELERTRRIWRDTANFCQIQLKHYGAEGSKMPNALARRDGEKALATCNRDGSCDPAHTSDVYFY